MIYVKKKNDPKDKDSLYEGRDNKSMDVDRMVNEGLGGGTISKDNGLIEETSTDAMDESD